MVHPVSINKETGEYNPYLAGRQEWDSIHGTALKREHAWRWVAILASLTAILVGAVALTLAGNARSLKPYVVIVDGETGRRLKSIEGVADSVREKTQVNALRSWIEDTRLITADDELQRRAGFRALSRIAKTSQCFGYVMDWWRTDLAKKRAAGSVVYGDVDPGALKTGDNTYELSWLETEYTAQSQGFRQHWKAAVTIAIREPKDEEEVNQNELGLFVTNVSWTKVGAVEEIKK